MLQQRAVPKESPLQLLVPALAQLDAYADALRRGWSPDNVRLAEAAREELELIAEDRAAFVAMLDDREAKAAPSPCPTARRCRACRATGAGCGTANSAARSAFAGSPAPRPCRPIAWAISATASCPGSSAAATPRGRWRCCCRKRARRASPMSSSTTDPDNLPSQKVITANGGVLVKRFRKEPAYGEAEALLFRIPL